MTKNNPGFGAGTALVGEMLEEGRSEVDRIQRSKEDVKYWESEARNRRGGRNSTSNDMAVVTLLVKVSVGLRLPT